MVGEWAERKLGEVLTLKRGYDLPKRDRHLGSHPVVSSSGVTGYHSEAKVRGPGVVTGRYGTLGEVHFVTEDFWPLNTSLYVEDFKGNDPRFVAYLLRGMNFEAYSDKSSVPGLNRNHLHAELVMLPLDVEQQRAIASFLGLLDENIDLNRRIGRALEATARAIFKAWFIDFEPVKAKALGAKSFKGMPQDIFDRLPDRFIETEAEPIPKGWEIVSLDQLFELNPRRTLKKGEVAPYLGMSNVATRGHVPDAWEERAYGSGMRFKNGDTLLARITPCLENGKTAFVDFLEPEEIGWGSTEYIVLRPRPPLPPIYAYCLARSRTFREFAIANMTGTSGRQRVSASALSHFKTVRPAKEIAVAFGKFVELFFSLVASHQAESRVLGSTRDTLLPKLISGEIEIPLEEERENVG